MSENAEVDHPDVEVARRPDDGTTVDVTTPTIDLAAAEAAATSGSSEGDAVAANRDPDVIAREIEQTRAELAETIDAIAERINPKRAAARGAQAAKAQVAHLSGGRVGGDPAARPEGPASVIDTGPRHAQSGMPVDPRIIAGAGAAGVVILLLIRRRRRR